MLISYYYWAIFESILFLLFISVCIEVSYAILVQQSLHNRVSPHWIHEVLDNYLLHWLFCPTVTRTKEENMVLIWGAGILMCCRRCESLMCFFDENINWFSWWIFASSLTRDTKLPVSILCLMWRAKAKRFKSHGAQMSAGHMLPTMCWSTWQCSDVGGRCACFWVIIIFSVSGRLLCNRTQLLL